MVRTADVGVKESICPDPQPGTYIVRLSRVCTWTMDVSSVLDVGK